MSLSELHQQSESGLVAVAHAVLLLSTVGLFFPVGTEVDRTSEKYKPKGGTKTAVAVYPSSLSGVRKIVDVVFDFTHRETDVTEKFFVRVDVTEEFPFMVTKLSPCFNVELLNLQ